MKIANVSAADFGAEVLDSDVPVVVDFYADWCGPCRRIAPALGELAERWGPAVKVVKIDTEAEPELARAYRIRTIPAIALFRGGDPVAWTIAPRSAPEIEAGLGIGRTHEIPGNGSEAAGSGDGRSHPGAAGGAAATGLVGRVRSWWRST